MIAAYLHQTCILTPLASTTDEGVATPGTPVTAACRFVPTSERLLLADGTLVVTRGTLYLAPTTAITLTHTVTINQVVYTVADLLDYPGFGGALVYRTAVLR